MFVVSGYSLLDGDVLVCGKDCVFGVILDVLGECIVVVVECVV